MIIEFYKSFAEKNRVNKSGFLILSETLEGTLRKETSILNPKIIVDIGTFYDGEGKLVVNDEQKFVVANGKKIIIEENYHFPKDINYAKIEEFGRFYFVTDIVTLNPTLYEVTMKCDVLMSFAADIYSIEGIVDRAEFSPSDPSLPQLDNKLLDNRLIKEQSFERLESEYSTTPFERPIHRANGYNYTLIYRSEL